MQCRHQKKIHNFTGEYKSGLKYLDKKNSCCKISNLLNIIYKFHVMPLKTPIPKLYNKRIKNEIRTCKQK